jgi:Carboxypeptidase regulatory-like domain
MTLAVAAVLLSAAPEGAHALPADGMSLRITGRVFDHAGAPIAHATVALDGAHSATTRTDDGGNYALTLALDGLHESAPRTVLFALHVTHGQERLAIADGTDTVRVEMAVLPGDAGAKLLMRSNSEAALGAVLGAFKTSSGRGEFRGDRATPVSVQLLFFGRTTIAASTPDTGMPFQDTAFLEGVEAAPVVPTTTKATTAPALTTPALTTPAPTTAKATPAVVVTRAAASAPETTSSGPAKTSAPAPAKAAAPAARTPAAIGASETHAIGGTVSTTGTMSKIFSSPSGGVPVLTPSAPDSAALARLLTPCECRVEGTIEVNWNQPLPHAFAVVVRLADEPGVRDTVSLFMGPPRTFTLLHVPCGAHPIELSLPRQEHFFLSGSAASRTADCARGHARDVHLVLVRRAEPPPSH